MTQRFVRPLQKELFMCPVELNLTASSGAVIFLPVDGLPTAWAATNPEIVAVITRFVIVYTEACNGVGTGSNLRVGYNGNDDGYISYNNAVQALGDVVNIVQPYGGEERVFGISHKYIDVRCMGTGAQTTGKVRVGVELSYDYTDWYDYQP
jgi:hypothetical protein